MFDILSSDDCNITGSTASCVGNKVYIVGGKRCQRSFVSPLLHINCFDLNLKSWIPIYSNTSGILNRLFHSSCVINTDIYLFGGCTVLSELGDECSREIIRIRDTEYGMVSTVHSLDENVARQGQSACLMGKARKCVVLYGGASVEKDPTIVGYPSKIYSTNVSLFAGSSESFALSQIEINSEDEIPVGRAFHTAVVCGDENEMMIICGGRNNDGLLKDIWILDMSSTLNIGDATPLLSASQKIKKTVNDKKKGFSSLNPTAKWSKLQLSETIVFAPRYLHSSFYVPSSNGGSTAGSQSGGSQGGLFCVFGGQGEFGPLGSKTIQLKFSVIDNMPTLTEVGENVLHSSAILDDRNNLETVHSATTTLFYGNTTDCFGAVEYNYSSPTAILIFGGVYEINGDRISNHGSRMIILDEENNILMKGLTRQSPIIPGAGGSEPGSGFQESSQSSYNENEIGPEGRIGEESKDSIQYRGDKKGSQRHGFGTLYDENRLIYEGNFRDDEYHGKGREVFENGDFYEGYFIKSKKDGPGVLTEISGAVYKGKWSADILLDGCYVTSYPMSKSVLPLKDKMSRGIFHHPGMSVSSILGCTNRMEVTSRSISIGGLYDGYLVDGKPCDSTGVCRYSDGGEYSGAWRVGKRNGQGTYTSSKGDTYSGKWVADERQGRGIWTSLTGGSYDGIWISDSPNGQGVMKYSDNSNYTGNFRNGKKSGMGTFVQCDKTVYRGMWENDLRLE